MTQKQYNKSINNLSSGKPVKYFELSSLLYQLGFNLERSNRHEVFYKEDVFVLVPNHKEISVGVVGKIYKKLVACNIISTANAIS